jgi:hypothetical protein
MVEADVNAVELLAGSHRREDFTDSKEKSRLPPREESRQETKPLKSRGA